MKTGGASAWLLTGLMMMISAELSGEESAKTPDGPTARIAVVDGTMESTGLAVKKGRLAVKPLPDHDEKALRVQHFQLDLALTDEAFMNGKQPEVELEIIDQKGGKNSRLDVWIHQDGKWKRLLMKWGSPGSWRTVRVPLSDMVFDPEAEQPHIRVERRGDDAWIKSIVLRGYDRANPANVDPLVRLRDVTTGKGIFCFHADEEKPFRLDLMNHLLLEAKLRARVRHFDRAGTLLQDGEWMEKTLPAQSGGNLDFAFQKKDVPYGQYRANVQVQGKRNDKWISLAERDVFFGIGSNTRLRKAEPGEFLYGLDMSLWIAASNENLLKFTEFMGVDIIRGGYSSWANRHEHYRSDLEAYRPLYAKYNLKHVYNMGPPDSRAGDKQAEIVQKQVEHLEWAAREYKDALPYFEIGNEPDIMFYKGPIEQYAADYEKLFHAIRRGNPDAGIANGGWAYGVDRIRTFYKVVDPETVDMVAYHAHGKGAEAERTSYRQKRALAAESGYGDKVFVDTETGLMAKTPEQELVQARTCIQKFVFVQSIGSPYMLWFRLWMGNREYGNTWNQTEPRPVILSYRAVAETLKGYRYARTLDLGTDQAEAYLFNEIDGDGRVIALWREEPGTHQATLHIAPSGKDVAEPRRIDMYGNASPAPVLASGLAVLDVTEDPVFLAWTATTKHEITVHPGLIQTPERLTLIENGDNALPIRVVNPRAADADVTIRLTANTSAPVTLKPQETSLSLPAGATRSLDIAAQVETVQSGYTWPETWTVFTKVDPVDLSQFNSIPETLSAGETKQAGRKEYLRDHTLDLARLGDYTRKKDTKSQAVLFTTIEADKDCVIRMGAGADWWMEWTVNGEPVYSTMEQGNGAGYTILDHVFEVPLKKGTNLLAARVLAGSHGWQVKIGSPAAVAEKLGSDTADHLVIDYVRDGEVLVRRRVDLEFRRPLADAPEAVWQDDPAAALAAWNGTSPTALLGEADVTNLHFWKPDALLWWGGFEDLSATTWLRKDDTYLYIAVKAVDDSHFPVAGEKTREAVDFLRLGLAPDDTLYQPAVIDCLPLPDGGARCEAFKGTLPEGMEAKVDRVDPEDAPAYTLYRVRVPREWFGGPAFACNFVLYDSDGEVRKQYIEWQSGLADTVDAAMWHRARFE